MWRSFPIRPGARIPLDSLQPFSAALPENPDTIEGLLNANVVLRWEYALGSTFFLEVPAANGPEDRAS